jgi:hypothetical protein
MDMCILDNGLSLTVASLGCPAVDKGNEPTRAICARTPILFYFLTT